jgi:hypothetical protein
MSGPKLWVVTLSRQVLALAENEDDAIEAVAANFSDIINGEFDIMFAAEPVERAEQVLDVLDQRLDDDLLTSKPWSLEDSEYGNTRVVDAVDEAGLLKVLYIKLKERR